MSEPTISGKIVQRVTDRIEFSRNSLASQDINHADGVELKLIRKSPA